MMNLTYHKYSDGFRYQMDNCLIDNAIRAIIWECRCKPSFYDCFDRDECANLGFCVGSGLYCLRSKLEAMAVGSDTGEPILVPEALENPDRIGNMTKQDPIHCLPLCKVQENTAQMSFSPYPQKKNFFYQKEFCITSSRILQVICAHESNTYFVSILIFAMFWSRLKNGLVLMHHVLIGQ